MNIEYDASDMLRAVQKHWLVSLIVFNIVLGGFIAYTYFIQPTYLAEGTVAILGGNQVSLLFGSILPKTTDIDTQLAVINSPSVIYPVYMKYRDELFRYNIENIKDSNLIRVGVESRTPEKAAEIANEIMFSYINYSMESRREEAASTVELIKEQLDIVSLELNSLNLEVVYYNNFGRIMPDNGALDIEDLERKIQAKGRIYDYLLYKKEEAALSERIKSSNIMILNYAQPVSEPVRPNLALNIFIGLLAAAFLSTAAAVMAKEMSSKKDNNEKRKALIKKMLDQKASMQGRDSEGMKPEKRP